MIEHPLDYALGIIVAGISAAGGWVMKQTLSHGTRLIKVETNIDNMQKSLDKLVDGQEKGGEKLDRIVDHLLKKNE